MSAKLEAAVAMPSGQSARRGSLGRQRILLAYVLVAPAMLWRLATVVYPFIYTFYLSFFDWSPIRRTFQFTGLENYTRLLQDERVLSTLSFTLIFTAASVFCQTVYGLAVASLLNKRFPGRDVARAANLLPWAMPLIVAGSAAVWIFHSDYGLINDLLWRLFGIRPIWLANVAGARLAVVLTDVWKNGPFLAVIFLGGLQGIPLELYEAAKVDGATGLRSFWYITLPLLKPLIITMAIFVGIYRILSFDIVYALTQGGPGTSTSLMAYRVYVEAFRSLNFGYASAMAIATFLLILLASLLGFLVLKSEWAKI